MTPAQVATYQSNAAKAITYVSTQPTEETTKTATLNAEAVWGNLIYASGDDDDDGAAHVKFVSAAPVGLTAYEDDGTKINLAGDNDDSDPIYMYYDKSSDTVYIAAENNSTIYAPADCSHLFDTSDFKSDFSSGTGMTALTTISLEALDTSNVTNMDSMFANCKSLTTIYVNTFDTSKVASSAGMFSDCEDLVGGSDTGWNKDNTNDVTYAHIDGGTSNPGYFTAYTATTSTTSDTASDTTDASDTVTNVTNSYTIDTTALTGVTARQTTDEEETTNEN